MEANATVISGSSAGGWRRAAYVLGPLLRGAIWALIGFGVGALATSAAQGEPSATGQSLVIGYVLALAGWLLGIGGWEAIVRPAFGGRVEWDEGEGIARYFRFNTDHKVIGLQVLFFTAATFLVAGLAAMNMRAELLTAQQNYFANSHQYLSVMSIHGTLMMFAVATVALFSGLGHYLVPLQIGARRMVFPRLEALTFWLFPAGVTLIISSLIFGGYQSGWTGYEPLASVDQSGQLFYAMGAMTVILASTLTGVNLIGTIVFMRARGLSWRRLPILVWSQLSTSFLNWFWFPLIAVAMILQISDRTIPTNFFRGYAEAGTHAGGAFAAGHYAESGLPLLWQDLFWLFGHPEVYIIMLPAWGIWLEIIPVFARKTLFAYRWAVFGLLGVAFLSSYVWVHHMFAATRGSRLIPFMTSTELISIPTSLVIMAAIGTLWRGRIRLKVPMLLVIFSIINFIIGGISGTFLADVPANFYETDTYFVVAHFHYTILGGMVFAWLAGMYYWLPKFSGRMFSERWALIASWLTFIFFNWTFFSMFLVGLNGMNRRVDTYPGYLEPQNLLITIPAWVLGLSFVLHVGVLAHGWLRGRPASDNPWNAKTLEWQAASPPPEHNFELDPVVVGDFYGYGEAPPEPELIGIPGIEEDAPITGETEAEPESERLS